VVHFSDVHFAYAYRGRFVAGLHHSFRQRLSILGNLRRAIVSWAYYQFAYKLAERPAVGRAAGLFAVSSATRDEYVRTYGVSPQRIVVAPHGIDTEFFHRRPTVTELRQRWGIADGEPVLLFVGFVTPRKGLEYLAQALPLIRPTPRLIIVGRWPEKYRSQFLRLLGPASERMIEAGYVPDEQLPDYYSLADVYVSASLMEGFGLTLAEALACQTPVVAAKAGSVAEVVGPGGILVPPRDPPALAEAISCLLQNPEQRRELGLRGRAHVVRAFSLVAMTRTMLAGYALFLPEHVQI
jgi:glycosyltransferase involved in cell wall biosynthesis